MFRIEGYPRAACDGITRPDAAGAAGAGLFGLSLPRLLAAEARAARPLAPPAKAVIFVNLFGGPSQLETFHSTTRVRSRRDEAKIVRLAHGNWGRAASRRGDPRGWRGARAGRSKPFRQACEHARGDPAGAHNPPDAAILQAHGVNHICGYPPDPGAKGAWTSDDLQRDA